MSIQPIVYHSFTVLIVVITLGPDVVPVLPRSDHQSLSTLSVIDVLSCSRVPDFPSLLLL